MNRNQRVILYILILIAGAAWIQFSVDKSGASMSGKISAPQAGFATPNFSLQTPDGVSYTLADLKGQAVLVNL